MRFSVRVVEIKDGHESLWIPVGFGEKTPSLVVRGRDAAHLRRTLTAALRKNLEEAEVPALVRQSAGGGYELRRVRASFQVQDGTRRVRYEARMPLLLERLVHARPADAPARTFAIAYHPLRPGSWFPVDEDAARSKTLFAEEASRWLPRVLGELGLSALEELQCKSRESLKLVSFSSPVRSLVDLAPADDPFGDLEVSAVRGKKPKKKGLATIRSIGENLSARAAEDALALGRPREPFRTTLQQLVIGASAGVPGATGKGRRSVVLVGDSGVGKSVMIHRLVGDMLAAEDFDSHGDLERVTRVYRVSGQRILAGMSHVGDWERRALAVLDEARTHNVVLVVEDIVEFARLGRSRDGDRSLADFFRGPVASGEVTLVAESTPGAWARLEGEAPGFAAAFSTVPVVAADRAETLLVLGQRTRELEAEGRLTVRMEGIEALLELGPVVNPASAMPGASLDLLGQLARTQRGSVGQYEVLTLASERTGLPRGLLSATGLPAFRPQDLRWRLGSRVLGQDEAVTAATDVILKLQAGLADRSRPLATYLFTGPTGTGKTELSKALAETLFGSRSRLIRLDMGEFSGGDAIHRLLGSPWEPRGLLTEAIRAQPFSIVLFDEVEKAHPAVHHLLLQLLDEGRLTDAGGERADFRRAVVIMTSNLGAQTKSTVGYGVDDAERVARDRRADALKAVRDFFPPELFNRIDRVVPFRPLTAEVAERVAAKELGELFTRPGLVRRQVFAFATPSATRRMVEQAFDDRYGARSVKRFLESEIGFRLAEHLATEPPTDAAIAMRTVRVYDDGRGFALQVETLDEAVADDAPRRLAPLLDAPLPRLQSALAESLGYVDSIRAGEVGEKLRAARAKELAAFQAGGLTSSDLFVADTFLSDLEEYRTDLGRLVEAPEMREEQEIEMELDSVRNDARDNWGQPIGRSGRRWDRRALPGAGARLERERLLDLLAERFFMEAALASVDEPGAHLVDLELVPLGRPGQGGGGPARGLLLRLVESLAQSRGDLLSVGWIDRHDQVQTFRNEAGDAAGADAIIGELRRSLVNAQPVALRLRMQGFGVRHYFATEEGSHILEEVGRPAEVVRVRVLPAKEREPMEEGLRAHRRRLEAFELALETGGQLPENPEALLPAVRRTHVERGHGDSPDLVEVEDYRLGDVRRASARHVRQAWVPLMRLHMTRELPEEVEHG